MKLLKTRLASIVIVSCAVVGALIAAWVVQTEVEQSQSFAREVTFTNAEQLRDLLGLSVKIKDRIGISRLIGGSSLKGTARSIKLTDSKGVSLYLYPENLAETADCKSWHSTGAITFEGEQIGNLSICFRDISQLNIRSIFLLVAGILGAILVLAVVLISRINSDMSFVFQLIDDLEKVEPSNIRIPRREHANQNIDQILRKLHGLFERTHQSALEFQQVSKEAAVGKLAAQVAHDIRSPLSALKIVSAKYSRNGDQAAGLISESVLRIERIAADLLDREKAAQNLNPTEQVFSAGTVLGKLVELKKWEYSKNPSLSIRLLNEDVVAEVFGDSQRFERVISNIINNSAQAMNYVGKISLDLVQESSVVRIEISDDGPGIPTQLLEQVGKNRVTTRSSGSGLGLFSAYKIIEEMNGRIDIESGHQGTRLSIRLPSDKTHSALRGTN